MRYAITFEAKPHADDVQMLSDKIADNAMKMRAHNPLTFFAYFIRDENNTIVGGVNGCNLYGCLYVDQLWVHESIRTEGYGKDLMLAAEQLGKEQGCTFAAVNTMDWEAKDFYMKLGYVVEFERHGFAKDSIFYFLRKDFS